MRKPVALVVAVVMSGIALFGLPSRAATQVSGRLYVVNGGVINCPRIGMSDGDPYGGDFTFFGEFRGEKITVRVTDLKAITFTGSGEATIELRNGKSYSLSRTSYIADAYQTVTYQFWDEVNQRWSSGRKFVGTREGYVSKIEYGEIGRMKECSKCQRYFPGDFMYCPYDQADLRWADIPDRP